MNFCISINFRDGFRNTRVDEGQLEVLTCVFGVKLFKPIRVGIGDLAFGRYKDDRDRLRFAGPHDDSVSMIAKDHLRQFRPHWKFSSSEG